MKKRFLIFTIVALLLISCLPVSVFAEQQEGIVILY